MCCTCACNRGIYIGGSGGTAAQCFLGRRRRWRGHRWWAARWRRRQGLKGAACGLARNGAGHVRESVQAVAGTRFGTCLCVPAMQWSPHDSARIAPVADAVWLCVHGMCAARCTMVGRGVRALEAVLAAGSRGVEGGQRGYGSHAAMVGILLFTFFTQDSIPGSLQTHCMQTHNLQTGRQQVLGASHVINWSSHQVINTSHQIGVCHQ